MTRLVEPPLANIDQLPTPLTDGERRVIDIFHESLPEEWEIYIQPHLNGLRPDIVLLHPRVGIAVFEIKDWNLRAMNYYSKVESGRHVLMACDQNGKHFSCEDKNPINKILQYERELLELYCPRLDHRAGMAVITAGLVFPCSPTTDVERVFTPFRRARDGMQNNPAYYPITGRESVVSGDVSALFPEFDRKTSKYMTERTAADLRGWLKEPFFAQEQRNPLPLLDEQQHRLTTTRTTSGYRRIRGPAGCGKSIVLAARASELAAEGKSVLVVSYNISLLNYLRDLAVRHGAGRRVIRLQIDFLNFHRWCKRVCAHTGHGEEYDGLWRESAESTGNGELQPEPVLEDRLARLVRQIYGTQMDAPSYDAILVDEGQDLLPSWWQTLRCALRRGGEMVLVVDKTQDIYATAANWTEEAMNNAGFRGNWVELKASYRLPPEVIPLVRGFVEEFLKETDADVPQHRDSEQMDLFPTELRWIHVRQDSKMLEACDAEVRSMMQRLRKNTAIPDITILSGNKKLGRELVRMQEEKNIKVLHTFQKDNKDSRRQKLAFFQGDARIKGTTVHSFKGLEARHLVVLVTSIDRAEERSVLYTALTRLLRDQHGSCLSVVSCCDKLRPYGRSWRIYKEC